MPRHDHREPGHALQESHVLRRLVCPAGPGPVVGRPDADQDGVRVLMPEVELDLLVGPFDQERRVGVHDRPHPGQRQPAAHADHQLFPDAHVEHPVRMPRRRLAEHIHGDLRQHHRGQRILVQQRRSRLREHTAHIRHGHYSSPSTVATTSCGPADVAPAAVTRNADASASWSRPETRTVDQPPTAKCASIPPGPQPQVEDWLATATTVRFGRPTAPAYTIASLLLPSSSSASPTSTYTRGAGSPRPRSPRASSPCATPTPIGRPCPSDPLAISTPGTSERSGW